MLLDATANSRLTMHEHGSDTTIIQSTDVSGAMARNAMLRSASATKTEGGDHHVASIPLDLLNAWGMRKYGVSWEVIAKDNGKLAEFLAEHQFCRIHEGRM